MSNFFFAQPDITNPFIDSLKLYANDKHKQIYVIHSPLGDSKYSYDYKDALVILCPKHKISFIDVGNDTTAFQEYINDFIEDLGSISDKYQYRDIIGRPKKWRPTLTYTANQPITDINQFFTDTALSENTDFKLSELIISLLTGSINDIVRVKENIPQTLLEKVKQRILLFDGEQTRFIYDYDEGSRVTIQGLSGTGKTELLLHKLKEIYLKSSKSKIMLTCHNKILADKLRNRIPRFFDFMKVEQQIQWHERLWCIHAWGSMNDKDSGAYRNICDFYDLTFHRWSRSMSFDKACKIAIDELTTSEKVTKLGCAYNNILLDESQDFPDSFIDLCELVSSETVYVAGDIFQSIFDDNIVSSISPNFLLSKCYRTDPRTLMFSHALGMGLFENPPLRWLNDDEWEKCGYIVEHNLNENTCTLKREPLRRFDDIDTGNIHSFSLVNTDSDTSENHVLNCIQELKNDNPDLSVEDIGIIFIGQNQQGYDLADRLELSIPRTFGWAVNKAYETKTTLPDHLFISNKNNVKGLEFPFVICVSDRIRNGLNYRNALYMMLTRSFITTYFLVPRTTNENLFDLFSAGLLEINSKGYMKVKVPDQESQKQIRTKIQHIGKNLSYDEFIASIFDELEIPLLFRASLYEATKPIISDNFNRENALEIVSFNFEKMES